MSDDAIRVIHADCREVMRGMAEGSVDAVVTSPPYNQLGKRVPSGGSGILSESRWLAKVNAKGYADDMAEPAYREWLASVASDLARVVRPGGSFFFNHKLRYRDGECVHPYEYVREWTDWDLRQEIIWDRAGGFAFNSRMFAPCDERVYWLVRRGDKHGWNQDSASLLSIWRIPSNKHENSSIKGHPCPFPVELPRRCILAVTQPGDLILDPFAGSGSTLVACAKSGRRAIGIESAARYIPVIHRRLKDAETPLLASLEANP